ncbi:MAG: GumC family protein [Desulfobaccales bacterium]
MMEGKTIFHQGLESHHQQEQLHDYLRILVKRRWAALAVFMVIVATTALYSFLATPVYKATTQILVERQMPRLLESREGSYSSDALNQEFYQTQYKLLASRALAEKVATKLDLYNNPNFTAKKMPADATALQRQYFKDRIINSLMKKIEVTPIRNSSLVDVSFNSPDPQLAALIVNTVGQAYIEQSLDLRFAASQEGVTWLNQRIGEARKKLEDSELKLNQYAREHNIVASENKETITSQKLEQLNKELITAQTKRSEAETRFREVSQGHPIPEIVNNKLIETLKGEEAKIIAQVSELGRKFGEKHPRMIQLNQELAGIRGKIASEHAYIVQSVKNEYRMAQNQETSLKKALEEQKADTQDLGDRSVEYKVLLRDAETNRALYENMLKSLKTTTATENLPSTNIRIIYPASVPEKPAKPKKALNLFLSFVVGSFMALGLVFGLEYVDTSIKNPDDVEKWLSIPNLAMIPHLETQEAQTKGQIPGLVVHYGGNPLAAEAYRALRTSIVFSAAGKAPGVILVTSSLPGEGKSLTSINLSAAMAKAGKDIVLIDADMRRPSLHKIFQVEQEPGLSNYLVGEINDLPCMPTVVPHLFLVPCGKIPPNPSELLGSARMEELLVKAQERFAQIIIDSPPLISVTDATILSTKSEGVLLVIRAEEVPRKAAKKAKDQLLGVNAHVLGSVLNDIPFQKHGYYYYNYYHKYQSYYYSHGDQEKSKKTRRSS